LSLINIFPSSGGGLHKLHEICDKQLGSLSNVLADDISSVADEVVGWWRTFEICGSVTNHDDFQTVDLQLTRVEISNLSDCLALSPAATRWLIDVEATVIAVEVEQQLVGEKIGQRNVELSRNGIDQRVKAARDEINFLVLSLQVVNEFSANRGEREESSISAVNEWKP
jgi:hypothetical protein